MVLGISIKIPGTILDYFKRHDCLLVHYCRKIAAMIDAMSRVTRVIQPHYVPSTELDKEILRKRILYFCVQNFTALRWEFYKNTVTFDIDKTPNKKSESTMEPT